MYKIYFNIELGLQSLSLCVFNIFVFSFLRCVHVVYSFSSVPRVPFAMRRQCVNGVGASVCVGSIYAVINMTASHTILSSIVRSVVVNVENGMMKTKGTNIFCVNALRVAHHDSVCSTCIYWFTWALLVHILMIHPFLYFTIIVFGIHNMRQSVWSQSALYNTVHRDTQFEIRAFVRYEQVQRMYIRRRN